MIEWIDNNYQIISVGFGLCAALFIILRVSLLGLQSLINYIEHEQRNKWQSEFFDRNHQEIKEMQKDINLLKQVYAAENGEVIDKSN
jgi:hypothetical protein